MKHGVSILCVVGEGGRCRWWLAKPALLQEAGVVHVVVPVVQRWCVLALNREAVEVAWQGIVRGVCRAISCARVVHKLRSTVLQRTVLGRRRYVLRGNVQGVLRCVEYGGFRGSAHCLCNTAGRVCTGCLSVGVDVVVGVDECSVKVRAA